MKKIIVAAVLITLLFSCKNSPASNENSKHQNDTPVIEKETSVVQKKTSAYQEETLSDMLAYLTEQVNNNDHSWADQVIAMHDPLIEIMLDMDFLESCLGLTKAEVFNRFPDAVTYNNLLRSYYLTGYSLEMSYKGNATVRFGVTLQFDKKYTLVQIIPNVRSRQNRLWKGDFYRLALLFYETFCSKYGDILECTVSPSEIEQEKDYSLRSLSGKKPPVHLSTSIGARGNLREIQISLGDSNSGQW